jgi:hypothetical protein
VVTKRRKRSGGKAIRPECRRCADRAAGRKRWDQNGFCGIFFVARKPEERYENAIRYFLAKRAFLADGAIYQNRQNDDSVRITIKEASV